MRVRLDEGVPIPRGALAIIFTCGVVVCMILAGCDNQPWARSPLPPSPTLSVH